MPLTDDQVLEAIKKANSEEIEKKVYDKIKGDLLKLRFAGGIGALIVLLFGLFHQSIFKIVVEQGSGGLKTEIRNSVDGDLKRLDEIRMKVTAMSEMTHRELDSILVSVANHHNQIVGIENRWKNKVDETNSLLEALTQKATEFAEKAKVLDERIKTAQSTTEALERRYKPIIATLEALAKSQDEIFKNQKEAATQSKTSIASLPKVSVPSIEAPTKGIVYFQFAGYSRDEANNVRKGLGDAKWTVPGADPVKGTATEVRYNPVDEAKAVALLADVKNVLRKLDLSPDISLSKEPLVKPGILELWIAKVAS